MVYQKYDGEKQKLYLLFNELLQLKFRVVGRRIIQKLLICLENIGKMK